MFHQKSQRLAHSLWLTEAQTDAQRVKLGTPSPEWVTALTRPQAGGLVLNRHLASQPREGLGLYRDVTMSVTSLTRDPEALWPELLPPVSSEPLRSPLSRAAS